MGSWEFGTLLGLAILLMPSAPAFAAAPANKGEGELEITVRVYDSAHLRRGALIAAEKQAARIFREAGLAIRWCNMTTGSAESLMDSGCDKFAGPAKLDLRIVPRLKVVPGLTADSTMGFAMGNLATVSHHWGKGEDPSDDPIPWEILAGAIAHEIGHLLLGANSHSPTGIMMGKWSSGVLRAASQGHLLFTPQQAELIRAEVLARSAERRALIAQMPAPQP
jgi:hypothetical protein